MMKKFKYFFKLPLAEQISNIKIANITFKLLIHFNFYIVILIFAFCILILLKPAFAQTCLLQSPNPRAEGLISAGTNISSKFGNTSGTCVSDLKAKFNEIPDYKRLKLLYYDQLKQTSSITKHAPLIGDQRETNIPMTTGTDHIYYIQKTTPTDGNLNIRGFISGTQTGVVFVEGNLNISQNLPYSSNTGLVFVVQGDVNIEQSIWQINAVIISSGKIYTATINDFSVVTPSITTCNHNNPINSNPLDVYGSLISLNANNKIEFCRTLSGTGNSTTPAEVINQQPKYLVILKDLFSENYQKWSELETAPAPAPTPTPIPPPAPPSCGTFGLSCCTGNVCNDGSTCSGGTCGSGGS